MTQQAEHHEVLQALLDHCRANGLAAEIGTMFRSPALRCQGTAFAFVGSHDTLIVKLSQQRIDELAREGIATHVTMGKRTMREWAEVPSQSTAQATRDVWADLTVEAHRFTVPEGQSKGPTRSQ